MAGSRPTLNTSYPKTKGKRVRHNNVFELSSFIKILLYSQQNNYILYSVRKYVSDLSICEIKSPNKRVLLPSLFGWFPFLVFGHWLTLNPPGKELTSFFFSGERVWVYRLVSHSVSLPDSWQLGLAIYCHSQLRKPTPYCPPSSVFPLFFPLQQSHTWW